MSTKEGIFGALVVLLIVGFFVFPFTLWLVVCAAFLGFLVATRDDRHRANEQTPSPFDRHRPWEDR